MRRAVFLPVLCLALWRVLPAQDFSRIDSQLEELESLIEDTLLNSREQEGQLKDLSVILEERESLLEERDRLLADLRHRLEGMSETYRTLSDSYARLGRSSRFWRTFMLAAVPAALGLGLLGGFLLGRR